MSRQVDAYIEALPPAKRVIAEHIRELICTTIPNVEEKYSFKIPFYYYFGMFCYLNEVPAGIELCFCRGKDLVMTWPQLETKGRAMVASLLLQSEKDIRQKQVAHILLHAADWNQEAKLSGISMVASKKKKGRN
jgi:hypothetical protein